MDDTILCTEIMMDTLCRSMGDYAPQKRQLIADYKDRCGKDINQSLTVWHSRRASDKSLVESVRKELAQSGYTLTALGELLEDGGAKVLYLAPATWRRLCVRWACRCRRILSSRLNYVKEAFTLSKIEMIERHIERTKAPNDRWALSMSEWLAIASMASKLEAVALAYNYGKSKGYRAAKAEVRK